MKVYPPRKSLSFPLTAKQLCGILDISKSTLFRWESEGIIPSPKYRLSGALEGRAYFSNDLPNIFKALALLKNARGLPKYMWLQDVDWSSADTVVSDSGYQIEICEDK